MIHSNAFDNRMSVCILRLPIDLVSQFTISESDNEILMDNSSTSTLNFVSLKPKGIMHCDSNLNIGASSTLTIPVPCEFIFVFF